MDPIYLSKDKPFIRIMSRVYEAIAGEPCEKNLAYGTSYAKALPNVVSFGPLFPGEEDRSHEKDERISEDSFMKGMRIYASVLAEMATREESLL
jgi:succinyl-diaminopimelate desuccinylase